MGLDVTSYSKTRVNRRTDPERYRSAVLWQSRFCCHTDPTTQTWIDSLICLMYKVRVNSTEEERRPEGVQNLWMTVNRPGSRMHSLAIWMHVKMQGSNKMASAKQRRH